MALAEAFLRAVTAALPAEALISEPEQLRTYECDAGTGLSGGALPVADGVVISLARLDRILDVDLERGRVECEPGVTNLEISRAVGADGFYYAPDPSSQQVCTIGGNVAE